MGWIKYLLVFVVIGLLITGFVLNGCEKTEAGMTIPRYSLKDRSISLEKGKQFMLVLPAKRDTGYRWVLNKPFDTRVIRLVSASYWLPEPANPDGSGEEHWTFMGVNKGQTTVELKYILPAKKEKNPKIFSFEITVR